MKFRKKISLKPEILIKQHKLQGSGENCIKICDLGGYFVLFANFGTIFVEETRDFETQDCETQDFETRDFETQDFEIQGFKYFGTIFVAETQDFETQDFETQKTLVERGFIFITTFV